jgi:hypothetical protein
MYMHMQVQVHVQMQVQVQVEVEVQLAVQVQVHISVAMTGSPWRRWSIERSAAGVDGSGRRALGPASRRSGQSDWGELHAGGVGAWIRLVTEREDWKGLPMGEWGKKGLGNWEDFENSSGHHFANRGKEGGEMRGTGGMGGSGGMGGAGGVGGRET